MKVKTYRAATMLVALIEERDRIQALLSQDREALEETLAATEHMISIYQARAAETAQSNLPKTLKAAQQIRSENNGNGKVRNAAGRLVNPHSNNQQQKLRIIATLSDPNNAKKNSMAPYINSGYLTKSAKGVYALTPKGKARLSELTHDPSA